MVKVNISDVIEYPTFRKNPGPLLNRAAEGRPLLLIKGRERLIVVDAGAYEELVRRAEGMPAGSAGNAAINGTAANSAIPAQRTGTEG